MELRKLWDIVSFLFAVNTFFPMGLGSMLQNSMKMVRNPQLSVRVAHMPWDSSVANAHATNQ